MKVLQTATQSTFIESAILLSDVNVNIDKLARNVI